MLGFFGKYGVLVAAVDAGLSWLAIAGVIASVVGAFYYLRIVYFMYFGEAQDDISVKATPVLKLFLVGSAAAMLLGVINLFGIEAPAALAAASLVN